jgi:hypothetical protein
VELDSSSGWACTTMRTDASLVGPLIAIRNGTVIVTN